MVICILSLDKCLFKDFHGGPVVKESPANAGGVGSIPGPERFRMLRGS